MLSKNMMTNESVAKPKHRDGETEEEPLKNRMQQRQDDDTAH